VVSPLRHDAPVARPGRTRLERRKRPSKRARFREKDHKSPEVLLSRSERVSTMRNPERRLQMYIGGGVLLLILIILLIIFLL
jgi:Tfp pilus assembly protein PilN